jgi:hypothetical protein
MGAALVLLFDLFSAVGVITCAYLLYQKYFAADSVEAPRVNTAYEKGFSDAVKYFGLRKLYEEDEALKRRMESVFADAGISHRILAKVKGADWDPDYADRNDKEEDHGKQQDRQRGHREGPF